MPDNSPPRRRMAQHTENRAGNSQPQLAREEEDEKKTQPFTREEREDFATSYGYDILHGKIRSSSYAADEVEFPNYRLGNPGHPQARPVYEEDELQPSSTNTVHRKINSVQQVRPREIPHRLRRSHPRLQHAALRARPSWNVLYHALSTSTQDTGIYSEALRRAHSRKMARRSNPARQDLGEVGQADPGQVASSGTSPSPQDPNLDDSSLDESSSDDSGLEDSSRESSLNETRRLEQRQRTLLALEGAGPWRTEEPERRTSVRLVPPPRLHNIFGRQNHRSQIGSIADVLRASNDGSYFNFLFGRPQPTFDPLARPKPPSQDAEVRNERENGRPTSAQQALYQMQSDFRRNPTPVPADLAQREWWIPMEERLLNFGDTDEEIRQREDSRWSSRNSWVPDPTVLEALDRPSPRARENRRSYIQFYGLEPNKQPPNNKDARTGDDQNLIGDVDDNSSDGKSSFVQTDYAKRLSRFDNDPEFRNVTGVHGDFILPVDAKQVRSSLHNNGPLSIPQPPSFPCLETALEESDKEIQRFVYYHLTSLRWTAWDRTPIARAWPNEIIAFCLQFQPSALSLNAAKEIADLRESKYGTDFTDVGAPLKNVVGVTKDVKQLFAYIVWLQVCELRGLEEQRDSTKVEIERLYKKNPWPAQGTSAEDDDSAALEVPAPTSAQEGREHNTRRLQRLSKAMDKLPFRFIRRLGRPTKDESNTERSAKNLGSTEQAMTEITSDSSKNAASNSNAAAVPPTEGNEVHDDTPHTSENEAGSSVPNGLGMRPRFRISRWSLVPFVERDISSNSLGQATRKHLQHFSKVF